MEERNQAVEGGAEDCKEMEGEEIGTGEEGHVCAYVER